MWRRIRNQSFFSALLCAVGWHSWEYMHTTKGGKERVYRCSRCRWWDKWVAK